MRLLSSPTRQSLLHLVFAAAACSLPAGAEPALLEQAINGMRKAGLHWANKVASHGGYVWEYSMDFVTRRRGESKDLPLSTNWVQPPGTPSVGEAFLEAYKATGEGRYLAAAVAAAHCLAWGQLESGGWAYSIEFDPERCRYQYHHVSRAKLAKTKRPLNTTTFDDNNTQSATRFLMGVDQFVDDAKIDAAIERALGVFLRAQYKGGNWDGAWPQRYPPPAKSYGALPTFNDNTMSDCARTMLLAYRYYGKQKYLDSLKRCLEFYLRSQQPPPQTAWAQQVDKDLRPAWARKFEPPAITGGESSGNLKLLMDMYIELGDKRYLDAVGRAVDWYERSRIGGTEERGLWARFYEIGTNRPLFFTRTYELVYTDDDLPIHYSFKGNYGVNSRIRQYRAIRKNGRQFYLRARSKKPTAGEWRQQAQAREKSIRKILDAQDEKGRWVKIVARTEQKRDRKGRVVMEIDKERKLPMMYSRDFIRNMKALANYIIAARGGPKVNPPEAAASPRKRSKQSD